jgi:pyruvate dehydrogenase E2 component (dihydrolipoamide acetyltransferase)
MINQFKFPDIGEGITEGEIVKWIVKEGDSIKEDQTLAEVETDKAVVEIPSPFSGTVLKIHFKEKDIVKVGDVLVTIGDEGEEIPAGLPSDDIVIEDPPAPSVVGEIKVSREEIREILATPKIRRMARQMGVDLKTIRGSGPEGRIMETDVSQSAFLAGLPKADKPQIRIKTKYDFYGSLDRIPLRGIRRATARKMAESVATAAHVTHFDEAHLTKLVELREKLKREAVEKNIKLTYLPFIVRALIEAMKLHPTLNASLDEEEQEIIIKKYYNIGIAVDVPDGLIVPVVKFADQKSLLDLAEEIQNLAEAAKSRKLDLADLKGGTFSITNVGMLGGEFATPIINYPEAAILATLRIADRVRAVGGKVTIIKTLPLCLSFDHRIIDGAEAARFMNDLIHFLENPEKIPD